MPWCATAVGDHAQHWAYDPVQWREGRCVGSRGWNGCLVEPGDHPTNYLKEQDRLSRVIRTDHK